jgi:hypothetical protein
MEYQFLFLRFLALRPGGDMAAISPLTILPLSVTVIGAAFAIVIFNHYFGTRRRTHELMWGIAFVLFAIASATQVFADASGGWTVVQARVYYLTGAVLNVVFLGLGTMYLLFSRRVATVALILTLIFSAISVYVLLTVPLDAGALTRGQAVDWRAVFGSDTSHTWLAALGSGVGSVVVVAGALYSGFNFWRKRIMKSRMFGVFLLAAGTFIVAAGGTLKGLMNNDHFLYPSMALGVIIMFIGYLQSIRPTAAPKSNATQTVPGRTPTT